MLQSGRDKVIHGLLEPKLVRRTGFCSYSLEERLRVHRVPGVSVAVINNYEIEWAEGFGTKEAGSPSPVTPETIFQACSISKVATAAGALRLVQEGVLDLDEDVNRYLVSWKVPANGAWQPRITLRQLLSHSAGTTVHGFYGYHRNDQIPTRQQILEGEWPAATKPVPVDTLPGVRYRYSGGGITIVEQLLADVTGRPFARSPSPCRSSGGRTPPAPTHRRAGCWTADGTSTRRPRRVGSGRRPLTWPA